MGLGEFFLRWRFELGKLRGLLLGDHLFTFCRSIEGHHLAQSKLAKLTRRDIETEGPVADATNFFNMMADLFKHLSDLAVATLGEGELVPWIVAAADELDLCR